MNSQKTNCKSCLAGRHEDCVTENCLCREDHNKPASLKDGVKVDLGPNHKKGDKSFLKDIDRNHVISKGKRSYLVSRVIAIWCYSCADLEEFESQVTQGRYVVHENPEQFEVCRSHKHRFKEITSDPKDTRTDAEILIEFAESKIHRIVKSSSDASKVFALISVNNHKETLELSSNHAINWLMSEYYRQAKKVYSNDSYNLALSLIKAKALFDENIPTEKVYKRVAFSNNEIFYDLGNRKWDIIKITSDAVTISEHGDDNLLFYRSANQCEQVKPNLDFNGNPLEELSKLTRIYGELFKVHLISHFIENIPTPIMVFVGMQGSVKSTVSALTKLIVDPSGTKLEDQLSHFPKSSDDLNIHLANNYLTAFDNVSYISKEVSDTLCKAITGASYPKRKLYKDTDESILKYQRKIVLNGITVNIDRTDLAERTIQYFTDKVPYNERLTSKEVRERFMKLLPDLLGQIFQTLQRAIPLYDVVKEELKGKPRMADFTIWGEAISRALGNNPNEFIRLYGESITQSSDLINENSPIISFIEEILGDQDEIKMSAFEFYSRLKIFAQNNQFDVTGHDFPKGANKLRDYFRRVKPITDHEGYDIEFEKNTIKGRFTKGATILKIREISSLPSPSSPQTCLDDSSSEHGEDGEHTLEGSSNV